MEPPSESPPLNVPSKPNGAAEQPVSRFAIRAVRYILATSDLVRDIKEAGEVVALFYSAFVLAFWLDQNSPIKLVHSIIIGICLTILFAILRNWANSLRHG